jgi:dTDP-4-dehydrorhamnose 3,5-epimerase
MPFTFTETALEGLLLIEPRAFADERGFFLESYKQSDFAAAGVGARFVQDNHSRSERGVLRGIHYQLPPYAQGKLVRVISGSVLDVAVDLRRSSDSFGKSVSVELSADNHRMLYIPPGFGHAFVALQDGTDFVYKCTAEYNKESEEGVRWDDPDLAIEWPEMDKLVSDKDAALPPLKVARLFT